jgi:hypothetical protein
VRRHCIFAEVQRVALAQQGFFSSKRGRAGEGPDVLQALRVLRAARECWRGSVQRTSLDGWLSEARYDSDGGQQQNGDCNGDKDAVHFVLSLRGEPQSATEEAIHPCPKGGSAYNECGIRVIRLSCSLQREA